MPLLVYLNYAYVLPRFGLWVLLLAVAFTDGWRHRGLRSRGYQLYWSLVGVLFLYVVRECLLLACSIEGSPPESGTFDAYIFFSNLADSVWFAILLSIAAGYCITRNTLGPHKTVVTVIPVIFFVTSLVVDYVLYYARGFDAFDVDTAYEPQIDPDSEQQVGEVTGLVFFVCIIANMMAFMLAWFYLFDVVQKEREYLEGRREEPGAAPAPAAAAPPAPGGGDGVGHRELPDDIRLLEAQGGNASHLPVVYGGVVDEDLDAPKTVQERLQHREKIRLMRQFFYGVSFYVIATLLVLFLPIFVSSTVDKTMLILQNAVLWVFLAALCFIFRMREDNPYLMVDDEGVESGLGGAETTTELGVIVQGAPLAPRESPPPSYAQVTRAAAAAAVPPASVPAGGPPPPVLPPLPGMPAGQVPRDEEGAYAERHFTLDEDEDHHSEHQRIAGGPSSTDPAVDVNSDAAKQGVLVTVLPSPKP